MPKTSKIDQNLRLRVCASLALIALPSVAQPYDDAAILKQMGFVAGQAVACGLDHVQVADAVTVTLADAMGYQDNITRTLITNAMKASQVEGCRPLPPVTRREFEKIWAGMKRKADVP